MACACLSDPIFSIPAMRPSPVLLFPRSRAARKALALAALAAVAALLAAAPARAQGRTVLAELINAYRAAPGACEGRQAKPAPPLAPQPALARARLAPSILLQVSLEQAGYKAERAEAISVSGLPDAKAAMAAIQPRYCRMLLSTRFTDVGIVHSGDEWLVVLAQPVQPLKLPDWLDAGKTILDAVNAARASARTCGTKRFAAAPPLAWNGLLGNAALAHSRDMAEHRFFEHQGTDGTDVGDRARQAGYDWRRIGENIASGLRSPADAVAGWLDSPGHCANIMQPAFTEMGAAYAINRASETETAYWTQAFGAPRQARAGVSTPEKPEDQAH
jgi:uncharacterized protein YkwD